MSLRLLCKPDWCYWGALVSHYTFFWFGWLQVLFSVIHHRFWVDWSPWSWKGMEAQLLWLGRGQAVVWQWDWAQGMGVTQHISQHEASGDRLAELSWSLWTWERFGYQEQPSKTWEKIVEKSEPDFLLDCTVREWKSSGYKVKQEWFQLDVWKTIFLWCMLNNGTRGQSLKDLSLEAFKIWLTKALEQPCLNLVLGLSWSSPFP